MTINHCTDSHIATGPAQADLRGRAVNFLSVWRQRRALSRLDADALRDIGVSPKEARSEVRRPLWDVPANWTK